MSFDYKVIDNHGRRTATAYIHGKFLGPVDDRHPHFDEIVSKLENDDLDGLEDLFDPSRRVAREFEKLSERVAVENGRVFFDGDEVNNTLTTHILRLLDAGEDPAHLVNFWEKIAQNPSETSRAHLMDWLSKEDFSITVDGDIVGYKGLREDGTSVHSGPGIVDGVQMRGHLPNNEGSLIELPRSQVDDNAFVGCSYGLHVGTHQYASTFGGGILVEVLVNPRDVVMVPQGDSHKMRVCRYKVGRKVSKLRHETVVYDYV